MNFEYLSIRCRHGHLEILDQTLLPHEEVWLNANEVSEMFDHIKRLAVRGAPLIAVAAVACLAVQASREGTTAEKLIKDTLHLKSSRPTAVNLMHMSDELTSQLRQSDPSSNPRDLVLKVAEDVIKKEVQMNQSMSRHGASLIQNGENILTHCNTGSLATPGVGTALGVIREAHRQGKNIHVYVDETRPLLQGGRLTAYELKSEGIPFTIICDNMAGFLMSQKKIDRVLVGSDRIATNGDFANKIGTYSLAVLADYHKIPFHPVAPASTVDPDCSSGNEIPIEERNPAEVLGVSGSQSVQWAPTGSNVYNPAFDVTPGHLVTSIILDTGVYDRQSIQNGSLHKLKFFDSKEK
ncbi:translation initiation factor eIF-2B alpha subunit [Planoprotostelium fungivorum]|uniref:Methylthioribose-1-phosphate isomerase n=1 Tax=Planoprotostelium fungivorum TaxID=1890364 RepID=A0A2P6MQQ6_9EUKA|nr:translation initiation factor eIF-2B alpha subunit [Planoprotostelium fungivorum]